MTNQEIANELEAMSEAQVARMNQTLTSKCYDEDDYPMSTGNEDAADALADEINGVSGNDIEEINQLTNKKKQLSQRPC